MQQSWPSAAKSAVLQTDKWVDVEPSRTGFLVGENSSRAREFLKHGKLVFPWERHAGEWVATHRSGRSSAVHHRYGSVQRGEKKGKTAFRGLAVGVVLCGGRFNQWEETEMPSKPKGTRAGALEPVLGHRRSHCREQPAGCNEEQPLRTATRAKPEQQRRPSTAKKERSVTHTGLPILVSLANRAVSFSCSITYPYTPKFKDFIVSYFYVDLQGQTSFVEKISCQPGTGSENQTHTTVCPITLKPRNASATGTYYCSVYWPDTRMTGKGTFILVRDTGYQEPPQSPQKLLLFCFVGILAVLSILATALLLWKKRQMWALWKHVAKKCPGPSAASSPGQPPSDSVYTDLQRRESEVYDCIQGEASSPPTSQGLLSQEKQHKFEGDGEFNLVYENL
ncbi:hypothetical protein MJG53_003878 [Ovis ammon polii x Ovis aries]|uniref:Uncharacterized protein n=1 Tax=Ovis ammon polii x Ovis aries TaxID=2918886 RepID=A0ACB9V8P4_9CETA|nr:hypothetical protein MJG53_003878 [Ovis ammon polii x Ovis aries]